MDFVPLQPYVLLFVPELSFRIAEWPLLNIYFASLQQSPADGTLTVWIFRNWTKQNHMKKWVWPGNGTPQINPRQRGEDTQNANSKKVLKRELK